MNTTLRIVQRLIDANVVSMGNQLVTYQPLPHSGLPYLDPFLLLHHTGPVEVDPHGPGLPFGPHPHRGFETATFIFAGDMRHHDSRGHSNVTYPGGVQWMTAGRGIVHSEGLSKALQEAGGIIEYIQLWINLPARLKMEQPSYQGFEKVAIPQVATNDGKGQISVFAGTFNQVTGPIRSITNIQASTIYLKSGGKLSLLVDFQRTVLFYVLHGQVIVNDDTIVGGHMLVEFSAAGTTINLQAESETTILFCSGIPYQEPMVSQGPFVMNTQTEIMEAMRDYRMGKMGVLYDE
jgi:redox-sensitive bicupin YhaK (pirin superfamily)